MKKKLCLNRTVLCLFVSASLMKEIQSSRLFITTIPKNGARHTLEKIIEGITGEKKPLGEKLTAIHKNEIEHLSLIAFMFPTHHMSKKTTRLSIMANSRPFCLFEIPRCISLLFILD